MILLDMDAMLAPGRRRDRYEKSYPACIRMLNEMAPSGGAELVVSSTWRYSKTVAELQEAMDAAGFASRMLERGPAAKPDAPEAELGMTPRLRGSALPKPEAQTP